MKNLDYFTKSALHCLSSGEFQDATSLYNRGLVAGLVSGLMARGMTFDNAIATIKRNMPKMYNRGDIPETWRNLF